MKTAGITIMHIIREYIPTYTATTSPFVDRIGYLILSQPDIRNSM